MTELNAFREEIRGWLQDNCPKSIQTPMAADEYPGGGRRAEYKNPETKLWLERCAEKGYTCLLYTSPSPRDRTRSRMPSSA